jgi:DNA-binding NarL/FixJ family response regulator
MTPIRTLIIAGDPLARAGITALLHSEPSLVIVGQADPSEPLEKTIEVYRPDVIVWDVGWSPAIGLETLIAQAEGLPPIIVLLGDAEWSQQLWFSGVRGLLGRRVSAPQLASAIQAAHHGLAIIAPELWPTFPRITPPSENPLPRGADFSSGEPLTPREIEVLQALAEGLPNKQIARHLAISEHTVKFHINAILGKLDAQSRTEAVVKATRAGLILL